MFVQLRLTSRTALFVGGGAVAARRARLVLEAGGRVVAITPQLGPEFPHNAEHVTVIARPYVAGDVRAHHIACSAHSGLVLVLACTNDVATNDLVAQEAAELGLFCNRADAAAESSLMFPAVRPLGPARIAVSAGGAGPDVARLIAEDACSALGGDHGTHATLARLMAHFRTQLQAQIARPATRRRVLAKLCTGCSVRLLARHGEGAWHRWAQRLLAAAHRTDNPGRNL